MTSLNTSALRVSVVSPNDLSLHQVARWRDLQHTSVDFLNPFLSPDFAQAVGRVHDNAQVAILERDGEVVGFFPHERGRLGIGRPIGAGISDCQALIHVPGLEWDPRPLLGGCGLSVWEFDSLLARQLPFAPYHTLRDGSPIMDLSGGYEAYVEGRLTSHPGSIRSTLRKVRKLHRELADVTFRFDVRDREALTVLMGWKSSQYRRNGWLNRFALNWIVKVVEEIFRSRTAECAGTLSMLYIGGRPIAGHFGPRSDLILSNWFPAYDVAFAKYSPGLLLYLFMAEAAAGEGIRYVDLGKGREAYKDLLKSWDLPIAEGCVHRPSAIATVRRAEQACRREFASRIVSHPLLHDAAHRALVQLRRASGLG